MNNQSRKTMYKDELIKSVAKASNNTNIATEAMLNAFADVVAKTLRKGQEVRWINFGVFKTQKRKARMGHNPKNQARLKIPAKTVARFVPGKMLVDAAKKSSRQ